MAHFHSDAEQQPGCGVEDCEVRDLLPQGKRAIPECPVIAGPMALELLGVLRQSDAEPSPP
jgi:hypothetical protein